MAAEETNPDCLPRTNSKLRNGPKDQFRVSQTTELKSNDSSTLNERCQCEAEGQNSLLGAALEYDEEQLHLGSGAQSKRNDNSTRKSTLNNGNRSKLNSVENDRSSAERYDQDCCCCSATEAETKKDKGKLKALSTATTEEKEEEEDGKPRSAKVGCGEEELRLTPGATSEWNEDALCSLPKSIIESGRKMERDRTKRNDGHLPMLGATDGGTEPIARREVKTLRSTIESDTMYGDEECLTPQTPAEDCNNQLELCDEMGQEDEHPSAMVEIYSPTRIFVRNLHKNIKERDLWNFFQKFGTVTNVRKGYKNKPFAFVTFAKRQYASKVLQTSSDKLVCRNRQLYVEQAKDKIKKPLIPRKKVTVRWVLLTPIDSLPNDILLHIFSFLDLPDRVAIPEVCKRWAYISQVVEPATNNTLEPSPI